MICLTRHASETVSYVWYMLHMYYHLFEKHIKASQLEGNSIFMPV